MRQCEVQLRRETILVEGDSKSNRGNRCLMDGRINGQGRCQSPNFDMSIVVQVRKRRCKSPIDIDMRRRNVGCSRYIDGLERYPGTLERGVYYEFESMLESPFYIWYCQILQCRLRKEMKKQVPLGPTTLADTNST